MLYNQRTSLDLSITIVVLDRLLQKLRFKTKYSVLTAEKPQNVSGADTNPKQASLGAKTAAPRFASMQGIRLKSGASVFKNLRDAGMNRPATGQKRNLHRRQL